MGERILVVDDVEDMRDLVVAVLHNAGFTVTQASSGAEAIQAIRLQNGGFAIYVLDVALDDINGFDLLKEIRALHPEAKACFLTGKRNREDVIKGLKAGAADYIVKPIDPVVFVSKINAMLGRNTSTKKEFVRLQASMSGKLVGMPIEIEVHIVEISEVDVVLTTGFPFKPGVDFDLEIPHLAKMSKDLQIFSCKTSKCEKENPNFKVTATFIGLSEQTTEKIRSLTIKGQKLVE